MKKVYTKYDYIDIYSKLGVMTSTFAAVSISLALFLGFVITLASHAHPDLSSRICLLLFVDAEENVTSQIILPTRKQLWGGIILLAVLAFAILFLSILMLWLMISYYENIFLILFIFLVSLSLPVLAVMVTYIRLLL